MAQANRIAKAKPFEGKSLESNLNAVAQISPDEIAEQ
jgi:hypothetical protein